MFKQHVAYLMKLEHRRRRPIEQVARDWIANAARLGVTGITVDELISSVSETEA